VATLEEIRSGAPYRAIDATGSALMEGLRAEFSHAGIEHEIVGYPAVFNVRFDLKGPTEYRSAMKANRERYMNFAYELLKRGIRILPRGTWFLSSAHEAVDVDKTLSAVREVLKGGI
jgi:glutamate-1-semialdehyde 2,1-aminomutase